MWQHLRDAAVVEGFADGFEWSGSSRKARNVAAHVVLEEEDKRCSWVENLLARRMWGFWSRESPASAGCNCTCKFSVKKGTGVKNPVWYFADQFSEVWVWIEQAAIVRIPSCPGVPWVPAVGA